jgi:hypothetical protein
MTRLHTAALLGPAMILIGVMLLVTFAPRARIAELPIDTVRIADWRAP